MLFIATWYSGGRSILEPEAETQGSRFACIIITSTQYIILQY